MYTFWNLYLDLCANKGVSPTKAARDMGFSNATASGWKTGAKPSDITIKKICDYFGVPSSYFENAVDLTYNLQLFAAKDELTSQEKKLLEIFRALDEVDRAKLLVTASDCLNNKQ